MAKDFQLNKTIEEMQKTGSIVLTGTDIKSAEAETYSDQTTNATKNVVSLEMNKKRNREVCGSNEGGKGSRREYRYLL